MSRRSLTATALVIVLTVSFLFFGPEWSWARVAGEDSVEGEVVSMCTLEDVAVLENGDALLSIVTTVPNSWLADKYRASFAAPSDADAGEEIQIPETRIQSAGISQNLVENAMPVQEEFYRSIQQEQEYTFGFTARVKSSRMVPKGNEGEFQFSVDATATLQVTDFDVAGSDSMWEVTVGPKDESAKKIVLGYLMTKITFAKMMLESVKGMQAYQVDWTTRIKLPSHATLLNSIELDGASWTLNFGGGTHIEARVSVEDSTVILNEKTFVTEGKVTAAPEEIFDAFCGYRNVILKYSLPGNPSTTHEGTAAVCFQRDSSFDWAFTLDNELDIPWLDFEPLQLTLKIKERVTVFGHLGWDFGGFLGLELQWFEAWLGVDTALTISLEGTAGTSVLTHTFSDSFDFVLATFYFWIGPVPFEANLNFEVKPSVEVGVDASVSFNAKLSFDAGFKAGLRYNGGWSPIFEKDFSCDKSWSFSSRIGAYLRPSVEFRLAFYIYNTAGPFVGFNPWANGEIEYHPIDDVANWTLSAGYALYVGFTCKGELSALLRLDDYSYSLVPKEASTIKQWPGHWGVANTDVSIDFPRDEIPLGSGAFISGEVTSAYPGNFHGFLEVKFSNNSGLDWYLVPSGQVYCTNLGDYHCWWVPSSEGDYLIETIYYGNSEYKANESIRKPLKVSLTCSGPAEYGSSDGQIDAAMTLPFVDPYTELYVGFRCKAPTVSWTLQKVRFFGNFTGLGFRFLRVEIWDSNLNSLYGNTYELQHWYNPDEPMKVTLMDIGPLVVSGDYYVCIRPVNYSDTISFVGMDVLPAPPNQTVYGDTYVMRSTWVGPLQYERSIDSQVANMDLILYVTGESVLTDHGIYGQEGAAITLRQNHIVYIDEDNVLINEKFNSTRWGFGGSQIKATWRDPDGSVFHTYQFTTPSEWNGDFWDSVSVPNNAALFYNYIGRPFEVEVNITYTRTWNDDNGTHTITNIATVITENFVVTKHPTVIYINVVPNSTSFGHQVNVTSLIWAPSGNPSGTMTLKQSTDNRTWYEIANGPLVPVNNAIGRYSANWTPPHAGEFFLQSIWSQDANNGNMQGMNYSESPIIRLTVNKSETLIENTLATHEIIAGNNLTIITSLTRPFDLLPLENKTIVFQISLDMSVWHTIGANNTNSTGQREYNWTVPDDIYTGQRFDNGTDPIIIQEGTTITGFYVRTMWLGDDDYFNGTSQTVDFVEVSPPPPTPVVDAIVSFSPQTFDPSINGTTVAAYIEIPEDNGITPLNASNIDVHTIGINNSIPILINGSIVYDYAKPEYNESENNLKVYFNGTAILDFIINSSDTDYGEVTFNVTGKLTDGAPFSGIITITYSLADIAIVDVTSSKTVVGSGYKMPVNVTVQNQGSAATTSVTLYATAENANNGLKAYWSFDEETGITAHDLSGYTSHGSFSAERAWEWQTAGNLEGWTTISDVTDLQCDGTSLKGTTTGGNPNIDSPGSLAIDASEAKTIHFRMNITNVSTAGVIYFTTADDPIWGGDKSIFFYLHDAGQWTEYNVDMSSILDWTGTITQIRLVPCQTIGTAFSLDWLRIGSNPTWIDGRYGSALNFDGVDDKVQAPFIPLNDQSFTITMWFNARSLPSFPVDAPILSQFDTPSADRYLHVILRDSRVYFGFYGDDLTGTTTLTKNTWYHIACVYNSSSNRKSIYINGILEAEGLSTSAYKGTSGLTEIGFYNGCFFNGTLDEVKIYDQALTGEIIKATANSGAIQTQQATLESWESANMTFTWDTSGWAKGNYILSVVATTVSGETDTADNVLYDGWVSVTIPGDLDANRKVNIVDIVIVALQFGRPPPPITDLRADINNDGKVNILDIAVVALHFGEAS